MKKSTEIAVKDARETELIATDIPEHLKGVFIEDAGKGVSTASEDNIIPLIYILQANSPQVAPRDPKYVAGAVAGDFWFRNSAIEEVVSGEGGFSFQPCYFSKVWIEWMPDRGGFAGRHILRPSDAEERIVLKEGRETRAWVRENGNTIVETREHAGFANGQPYVLPFSSTGHTESKSWMQLMNQFMVPGTTNLAPSFSRKYRIVSYERSNKVGRWFACKIRDAGWVTSIEEYNKGKALHEAFARGEKRTDSPMESASDEDVPF